jgi:hypothetical protein
MKARDDEPVDWELLAVGREVRLRFREAGVAVTLVCTVVGCTERTATVRPWGSHHTFGLHRSVVLRVKPITGAVVLAARSAIAEQQRQRLKRIRSAGTAS